MLIQQITPEILDWISAQAQAGHPQEAVLDALRRSGWDEPIARNAIEQLKSGRLLDVPPPGIVPDPDPTDSRYDFDAGGRRVRVLMSLRMPRVVVFAGLLAEEECDELIALARPRVARSGVIGTWGGDDEISDWRTSEGMGFRRAEHPLLVRIEQRIADLVRWPAAHAEGIQVLRYAQGAQYRPHHDYFDPSVPGTAVHMRNGGQRVATLVMYLNTPAGGGATTFPETGLSVAPLKGNAVFFSYDRPHQITRTLHGGAPVTSGEKWIATKWLRQSALE